MALMVLRGVSVSFGDQPLLDQVDLQIEKGERLCLLGVNGAGKSTLMRIIGGEIQPDEGEVRQRQGVRIARLAQEVPGATSGSVFEIVAAGLGESGRLLVRHERLSRELAATPGSTALLAELTEVQHALDAGDGWSGRSRVEALLSRLGVAPEAEFAHLSGGLKRRVMLAQALVTEPDLLLLDEPTNHLDLDAVTWLEEFFASWPGTLLFVTHDRAFLKKLATRIIELDRGRLTSWPGSYATYLQRKEAALEAEAQQQALFDKKLAAEEVWIRQGIKARRTRNEGRVRALQKLRDQRRQRRELAGRAKIAANQAESSGKVVIEAQGICHGYGERILIRDFSTTIFRGDKVALIGPNGVGKTTLLRILLGRLAPDSGSVRLGTRLAPAYFDQQREQLEEEKSVRDNLALGSDTITVNGQSKHVLGYLQDFLFSPRRALTPVRALSGGERNRLLLARLFARPANLLVLDEPTNDLDVETLELLESLLVDYPGTVLLVSHDRAFIDNVVTGSLVFEGDGRIGEYVGGYEEWLRQRKPAPNPPPAAAPPSAQRAAVRGKPRKLGYNEQRELETLPGRIEVLEAEQEVLHRAMSSAEFYKKPAQAIGEAQGRLAAIEKELADLYDRWETLEALKG